MGSGQLGGNDLHRTSDVTIMDMDHYDVIAGKYYCTFMWDPIGRRRITHTKGQYYGNSVILFRY